MDFIRKFSRFLGRQVSISKEADLCASVFDLDATGEEFFDLVLARFLEFDEHNPEKSKIAPDDLDHMLQSAIADIKPTQFSDRSSKRIDAYLYIYRRLEEYSQSSYKQPKSLQDVQKSLLHLLVYVFEKTQGKEPNLIIHDKNQLLKIDVAQHLTSIETINDLETLMKFFVLCKLSIQSTKLIENGQQTFQWIEVFSKVKGIKISLEQVVKCYIDYQKVFEDRPFNTAVLIHLIPRTRLGCLQKISPFKVYAKLNQCLEGDFNVFLEQFSSIFSEVIKKNQYETKNLAELLECIGANQPLFNKYWSDYSISASEDDLWNIFLHFNMTKGFNEIMQRHVVATLNRKLLLQSVITFRERARSASNYLTDLSEEFRPRFRAMFGEILDNYISKKIDDPNYSGQFTRFDCKNFLKICLEFSSGQDLSSKSCLSLIHKILFDFENHRTHAQKLKNLFQNLEDFDVNLCQQQSPEAIIKDEWLKYIAISNLQTWLKLDRETYQYLCDHHRKNPWTIYIWSRIVTLTFSKMTDVNLNEILSKMDEWLKTVRHDVHRSDDILTIMLLYELFQRFLLQNARSVLSLPNIPTILNFLIAMREDETQRFDVQPIKDFVQNGHEALAEILQLKSKCSLYRDLSTDSIIRCFLSALNLQTVFEQMDRDQYRFPPMTEQIEAIVALPKPVSIDIDNIQSSTEFFDRFIRQVNEWLDWSERFIDIFQYILDWMKNHHVQGSNQLLVGLLSIRDDPKMTLLQMRIVIERVLKLLQPFKDLRRLCHLFNCLVSFEIVDRGTLKSEQDTTKFLKEIKHLQLTNSFTVEGRNSREQIISFAERQQMQWSLASENHQCTVLAEYRIHGTNTQYETLYQKDKAPIHKNMLQGQFKSQRRGQLIITIDNKDNKDPRTLWYRVKCTGLSTCHLFHGIFNMHYEKYYGQSSQNLSEQKLSQLLDEVFQFIGRLLSGDLHLRAMTELRTIFYDKNIDIREEVRKLFTDRANEEEIKQVCEWLQVYQYYSHLNVIMECIEIFDLIPKNNEEETIRHLKRLSENENCSLREITQTYRILQDRLKELTHQHLQLIKTAVECSTVVQRMKEADLYSNHGRRRFQELKDNLTTQFQLQELNNMILNSWIITYQLIEPFVYKAKNFDEFIARLAQLKNLEESSLNHLKVINDNMQMVSMWLSTDERTILDNALITMEHLYKTGSASFYLRHLTGKSSYYEIAYTTTGRLPTDLAQDNQEVQEKKVPVLLSMSDVEDHKRQLTFCNVDAHQNLVQKEALINGQLKLLKTVENIYEIFRKLELAGHPDYQLRDEHYEIHLENVQMGSMLADLQDQQNVQINNAIKNQTYNLQLIFNSFQTTYHMWIEHLKKYRRKCSLLNCFSNREIMILIILLRKSNERNSIRHRFMKNLFAFEDLNEENLDFLALCLQHYLRTLRIFNANLTTQYLNELYREHQIEQESNTEVCLRKLSAFLRSLFGNDEQLFARQNIDHENEQFLVHLPRVPTNQNQVSFAHELDLHTCCILLNIFQTRLPASFQILWCSNTTEEDIELFFQRIRTFPSLTFAILDIDQMHYRLRELLLNEQDFLARQTDHHGRVFYFSRDLTSFRKGLRTFRIPDFYKDSSETHQHLIQLFNEHQLTPGHIQIVCGKAGIGKTHRINQIYKKDQTICFSINEKLDLSLLISSFLRYDSNMINEEPSIFFNISIHAPFESLNRTFFSLFICGCLNDPNSGLIFSLPNDQRWKFIIEVPYSATSGVDVRENSSQILPILSIVSPSASEEVIDENYQLSIGEEEELIARFLKAFADRTIDRMVTLVGQKEIEVTFEKITDHDECRKQIYKCIQQYAPDLPRNKIYELSFTKFLYRRARFFDGFFYRCNSNIQRLGSITMQQMITEAKALTQINFRVSNYPRVYFTYDPCFALRLLHTNWNDVPLELKSLFKNQDPAKFDDFINKDYFAACLAWLIDLHYDRFVKVIEETKFILTEDFAYKLFHIHERKLTRLPLIIEGETGVGKTFLLKFYSLLLNARVADSPHQGNIIPRIVENCNKFLRSIIITMKNEQPNLLKTFLQRIKPIILDFANNQDDDDSLMDPIPQQQDHEPLDTAFFEEVKQSLANHKYNEQLLQRIWKILLHTSNQMANTSTETFIQNLFEFVSRELDHYPLIEASSQLKNILQKNGPKTMQISMKVLEEYLLYTERKTLFYRLLLHPGVSEEQLIKFMSPVSQLARQLPQIEIIVFFDEVNTASCLGLFKEMFMDRTLHGESIPANIFFTAAINPSKKENTNTNQVHRTDYIVHELPQSLQDLVVAYGSLELKSLKEYIGRKIAKFQVPSVGENKETMPLEKYVQDTLAGSILKAQEFCEEHLGQNSVSQREIQRCFTLIEFFWTMRYDEELAQEQQTFSPDPIRCIALAIALTYYFRFPTDQDNRQRNDGKSSSRERLAELLNESIPDFEQRIHNELACFVNTNNFVIPQGVAINQAVREHIFAIVVSLTTRTPLCIIGVPGQSKTLSFQIVLQNLQGPQLSAKPFCKRLPAIDPFFCLGSKYTRSEDIAFAFDRAIEREQQYEQNRINTRCVVFLDEASLPDEKKMALKVLHPYLDECKVAFVAVANKVFDAANANRMICIYRSLPSEEDQKILAYGCLGLQSAQHQSSVNDRLKKIIYGLCQGYRRVLCSDDIPHIFHDRDFI